MSGPLGLARRRRPVLSYHDRIILPGRWPWRPFVRDCRHRACPGGGMGDLVTRAAGAVDVNGPHDDPHGAGDGNRTRIASLEGWHSTIELLPPGEWCQCLLYQTGPPFPTQSGRRDGGTPPGSRPPLAARGRRGCGGDSADRWLGVRWGLAVARYASCRSRRSWFLKIRLTVTIAPAL